MTSTSATHKLISNDDGFYHMRIQSKCRMSFENGFSFSQKTYIFRKWIPLAMIYCQISLLEGVFVDFGIFQAIAVPPILIETFGKSIRIYRELWSLGNDLFVCNRRYLTMEHLLLSTSLFQHSHHSVLLAYIQHPSFWVTLFLQCLYSSRCLIRPLLRRMSRQSRHT